MDKLDTITTTHSGHTINVHVYADYHMGPPWKEHDGHGIVSEWTSRDKHAGELVLCSDRGSKRYYDLAETMKLAKRDGWGLGDEAKSKLAAKLGRQPTKGEILHASVMSDYEYLRGWCNDEWHWVGYQTEILAPDGTKLDVEHDSCWGYDDTDYMVKEAQEIAQSAIDCHLEETARELVESQAMACRDIATV